MNEQINTEIPIEFSAKLLAREVKKDDTTYYFLQGIASSTNLDKLQTIFSDACQRGFTEDIQNDNVIVELKHTERGFPDFIGAVSSAGLIRDPETDTTNLFVEIELNPNHFVSAWLYKVVTNPNPRFGEPTNLGLSIRGDVISYHYENIEGKAIRVFDRVKLKYIAITDQPANADTFVEVIKREVDKSEVEREMSEGKSEEKKSLYEKFASIQNNFLEQIKNMFDKEIKTNEEVKDFGNSENQPAADSTCTSSEGTEPSSDAANCGTEQRSQEATEVIIEKEEEKLVEVENKETPVVTPEVPVAEVVETPELVSREVFDSTVAELNSKLDSLIAAVGKPASVEDVKREISDKVAELTNTITALKTQNETIARELEEIKNQPTTTPGSQLGTVAREVDEQKRLDEAYKSGQLRGKVKVEYEAEALKKAFNL